MKLSYRGIPYDIVQTALGIEEGAVAGKYRGQEWQYHYPRHIPHLRPRIYMQYRGIAYSTCPIPRTKTANTFDLNKELNNNLNTYLPVATSREYESHTVDETLNNKHLENMRRSLERRLKVAKAKGDRQLIGLLERESHQLAT